MRDQDRDELAALFDVMAQLRAPGGCPWDRAQSHQTLGSFLLEESYELLQALEQDSTEDIVEELGDLLVQIAMQCAVGEEEGRFTSGQVAAEARRKMVRRHPHVFGESAASSLSEVVGSWAELKRLEKPQRRSPVDGVPKTLPALAMAMAIQRRAAGAGVDDFAEEGSDGAVAGTDLERLRSGEEAALGTLLFSVVALARRLGLDPEAALRAEVERRRTVYEHRLEPASEDRAAPPER